VILNMKRTCDWERLYEEAILETSRAALPKRIQAAQSAIEARLAQLHSGNDGSDERQAIITALRGLKLLREEIEDATQHPSRQTT
jgi:hypothetical protein